MQTCYIADWRDIDGGRHRKSFPTAKEALTYEREQKAAVLREKAKRLDPKVKNS